MMTRIFESIFLLRLLLHVRSAPSGSGVYEPCTADTDCHGGLHCASVFAADPLTCQYCYCDWIDYESKLCPSYCLCQSSQDCPTGWYCRKSIDTIYDFQPNDDRATCVPCDSHLCSEMWLAASSSLQEECESVCPNDHQCNQHSDCSNITGHDESSWCTANHQCQPCSSSCWTPRRLGPDYQLEDTSYYNNYFYQENESIDLSCPETCCDWGLNASMDIVLRPDVESLRVNIGACNASRVFDAYWTAGLDNHLSPNEFIEKGNPCQVKRYDFDDGLFPSSVSIVDCSQADIVAECDQGDLTVALIEVAPNTSSSFVNIATGFGDILPTYPMAGTIDKNSESCSFQDFFRFLSILLTIVIVVAISSVVACIYCCCRSCRKPTTNGQESPIPVQVACPAEFATPVEFATPAGFVTTQTVTPVVVDAETMVFVNAVEDPGIQTRPEVVHTDVVLVDDAEDTQPTPSHQRQDATNRSGP